MANPLKEFSRVIETSSSTGTGALTLAGNVDGFLAFGDVYADGEQAIVIISKDTDWEISKVTYSSGSNSISRSVYKSTNANAAVAWGTGDKTIRVIHPGWSDLDAAGRAALLEVMTSIGEIAVASAGTCDILGAASPRVEITGTTTITSFGTGANKTRFVRFSGALTLTHNATSLILPGAANIVTAAGDTCIVFSDGSSNARVFAYQRAGGSVLTAASTTQVLTGTATTPAVTPDALAALWEQGSDVATAGTISFGEGGFFYLTGSTTITDIDFATDKNGRMVWVRVIDGGGIITHGAALVCPNGASITTAAGDTFLVVSQGSDVVRIIDYNRYTGHTLHGAATNAEVLTGTDALKLVTPDTLAALWEQGSTVASAATISLGDGGYFSISGTTGISDIDFSTDKAGRRAWLLFQGALTITHNGTTLILPGAANITTAAGDIMEIVSEGSDAIRVVSYTRASGQPLFGAASTTEALTGTDANKVVTSDALAALWEKGSAIASAGTISIGEGGFFHITGTTTITDIDFAVAKDGRLVWLEFDGILTLTHNGTTLTLPTAANITTAAGDRCCVVQDSGDNVHVLAYERYDGKAPGLGNVDNTSDATKFTSPALTGTPTAPTAGTIGLGSTQIATTQFVGRRIYQMNAFISDDAVGDMGSIAAMGINSGITTGLLIVSSAASSRVSLFGFTINGTNSLSTIFLGATSLNGGNSGAGAPAGGSGTDTNMITYISDDDHIYISNRIGSAQSFGVAVIAVF